MPDELEGINFDITPEALEEEFVSFPAQLARANALYADAYRLEGIEKAAYDQERAKVRLLMREEHKKPASSEKGDRFKGPTTDDIDAMVTIDPRVVAARLAWVGADARREHLRGVCDALRAKRDAMLAIGRQIVVEMQGDPVVRQQRADARQMRGM